MPSEFEGKLVEYLCPGGLDLLNYPDRTHSPWRFESVHESTTGGRTHFIPQGTVVVLIAWYARD